MKTKRFVISLITYLIFSSAGLFAQTNALYFMKNVPLRNELNPGFIPTQKFYVILPTIYSGFMTNSFAPNDFVKSINGEMKTAFDEGVDTQSFLNSLKPDNYINSEIKLDLLGFGFKVKKNYFFLGVSERNISSASVPYNLPWLLLNGLKSENKNLDFTSLGMDFSMFSETSLGYTREILPNLSAGVKVKYLAGQVYSKISFTSLNLTGNYSLSHLTGNGTVESYTPVEIPADEEGNPDLNSIDFKPKDLYMPCGSGVAFDFGVVYKPLKNLTLSASVTDLGSIKWNKNNWIGQLKAETEFKNVSFDIHGDDTNGTVGDTLSVAFDFKQNSSTRTSKLTSHTRLGAEYSILNDKISFGLLYDYRKSIYLSEGVITGSVNFRPFRAINATVAYSQVSAKTGTLGAGLNFNLGPITLFLLSDYIPVSFADSYVPKTNHINVKTGLVLGFGNNQKKSKETDDIPEIPAEVPTK